jgi:hypothetical protein
MIQLTNSDFQTLCTAGTVRERIGALEGERKAAVRKFWLRGSIGLALAVAALLTLLNAGWARRRLRRLRALPGRHRHRGRRTR